MALPYTLSGVRKTLGALGITIRHSVDLDEYCVNYKGGSEATAYYTSDLGDALKAGVAMSRPGKPQCGLSLIGL